MVKTGLYPWEKLEKASKLRSAGHGREGNEVRPPWVYAPLLLNTSPRKTELRTPKNSAENVVDASTT
jgi:hypothetical protein